MTQTLTLNGREKTFNTELVKCKKASHDSYAKNITCETDSDTPKFRFYINQVSTHFDPDIYAAEQKLQLYSSEI